ncbi:MAG: FliG C-terminal domain-containing protein [Bacteriovoracaceae bacterium]
MGKYDGFKDALEILNKLPPNERQKLLSEMAKRDPQMTEALKQNLISFEDLQKLSVKQFAELLREINLDDMALALRLGSQELKTFVLKNVSSGMQKQIEDILLGPLKQVNTCQEAMGKIMDVVRAKVDKGELVFDDSDEYV